MLKILMLSCLILSYKCFSSVCTEYNLLNEPNSPFLDLEVYNQESLNICYAIAASDLINFEFNGQKLHPILIALNYSKKKQKPILDIGVTKDAISFLDNISNCDFKLIQDNLEKKFGKNIYNYISKFFKKTKKPLNAMKSFEEEILSICKDNVTIASTNIEVERKDFHELQNDDSFENFILHFLNNNKKPLSITYCSNIWRDEGYDGIDLNQYGFRDKLKKDCHYHESTIIGKKLIDNKCHVLVRNSWGNSWTKDNSKNLCLCRNRQNNNLIDNCNSSEFKDHEVLACWLPSKELARNTGAVTFIRDFRIIPYSSPPSSNSLSHSTPPR